MNVFKYFKAKCERSILVNVNVNVNHVYSGHAPSYTSTKLS